MNDDVEVIFSEGGDLLRYSLHYDMSGRSKLESGYPLASVVQNTCKASFYIVMETRCMIIKSVVQMRFEGMPISSPEIHRVILPQGRGARGRYILPLIISLQEQFLPCRGH
ncbi:hypothetical protein D5086_015855 [Populus alba]|uniref:Uncharacterized protein n=1 Tax=Populus alba TaxID=43335 RepID=A0ACC4BUE2_POPAL